MDNKEEKSEICQLAVEKVDEHKATKSEEIHNTDIDPPKIVTIGNDANTDVEQVKVKVEEENNNDQVIIDPPKVVTIESDAKQVKDEEKNNSISGEGNKNEQVETEIVYSVDINQSEKESKCRPIAFLLGLPFALISLFIAFIGGIIWIIGFVFFL